MNEEEISYLWGPEVFLNTDFQINVRPVDGAIEGVQKLLDEGHELTVVTDRSPRIQEVTRAWLDKHGLTNLPVVFTRNKDVRTYQEAMRTKAQVAWSRRLTHVVEDAPHHSLGLAERPYIEKVWLLDKPYNRHVEHPKIARISSWKEVT